MRLIISCKIRKVNGFNNKPFRLKKRPCSKKQGRFKFIPSLQMQYSILDLGGSALVPELGADIAAGAAGNVQLVLVAVMALGALPDQLAVLRHNLNFTVVAADLAVVALGVQFGIHDVLVDELHDLDDGFEVILHIGYFHVADGTARGQLLELALEF